MPLPEDYVDGDVLSAADVNAITAAVNLIDPTDAISKTLIDAKGDLIVGTAADTAGRLAVGANGTVLTADSGETTGLKWVPAGGLPGSTLIVSQTFTAVSSVSLDDVFTTDYDSYQIVLNPASTTTAAASGSWRLRASGTDVTTNYTQQQLFANGNTVTSSRVVNGTSFFAGATSDHGSLIVLNVSLPASAVRTLAHLQAMNHASNGSGNIQSVYTTNVHNLANAYDGITFTWTTTTVSGLIAVYGLEQ